MPDRETDRDQSRQRECRFLKVDSVRNAGQRNLALYSGNFRIPLYTRINHLDTFVLRNYHSISVLVPDKAFSIRSVILYSCIVFFLILKPSLQQKNHLT